jgi:RNA polymerase sigma-70 factor (ECF subfamily)
MPRPQDEEWSAMMCAALDGDSAAYRLLLNALAPALRGVVRRGLSRYRAGDTEMEDIVQETLLAIHLKRHTWARTEAITPWVMAIARNKMIDALRRTGR